MLRGGNEMRKSLTQQLAEARESEQYWKGKYDGVHEELRDLKAKNEKEQQNRIGSINVELERSSNLNEQMMEIVRWHINPKTAERKNGCPNCGRPREGSSNRCFNCNYRF